MTTFPTITRIDIRAEEANGARDRLAEIFPNAEISFSVDVATYQTAAYAGKWYQADRQSPVYAAIDAAVR